MKRKTKYQSVEAHYGKPMIEILEMLFAKHGSQRAVAKVLGINQSTLYVWLLKLGLRQHTTLVRKGGDAVE